MAPSFRLVVIPARMASTRLPGKPLAAIAGVPMVVHVARRAREAAIGRVAVATDSMEVVDAVRDHGFEAVMTREDHPSGSDRVFEAARFLDPKSECGTVVNLQGDLPTIDPGAIRVVTAPLDTPGADIATLVAASDGVTDMTDPGIVKVVGAPVARNRFRALYFTRAAVPHGDGLLYHHIGVYAFRRDALSRFASLPPSALERRESLEQLRALEAGMRIDAAVVDAVPLGVDTPADLERTRALAARQMPEGRR